MLRLLGITQSPLRAAAAVAVLGTMLLGTEVSAAAQVAAAAAIIAAALAAAHRGTLAQWRGTSS